MFILIIILQKFFTVHQKHKYGLVFFPYILLHEVYTYKYLNIKKGSYLTIYVHIILNSIK